MYLQPEQLRKNLQALDSETLIAKVQSGQLTADASAVAQAVLKERGVETTTASAPSLPHGLTNATQASAQKSAAGTLLVLYVAFVIVCVLVMFADPPWVKPANGSWQGMIGFLASLAAGAPWSIGVLLAQGSEVSAGQSVISSLFCACVNIAILIGYARRR